jgi:hypothetical protein
VASNAIRSVANRCLIPCNEPIARELISRLCSCVCKVFLVAALIPSTALKTSEAASPLSEAVEKELLTGLLEDEEKEVAEEGAGATSSIDPKADEMSCFTGGINEEEEGVDGNGGRVDEAIVDGVEGRAVFVEEIETAGVSGVTGAADGGTSPGIGGAFNRKFFKLNGNEGGSG